MTDVPASLGAVGEILARARQAAIDYCQLTGKPLGITIADARAPAHDGDQP